LLNKTKVFDGNFLKNCLFHIWTCTFIASLSEEYFGAEIAREYYMERNGMNVWHHNKRCS